MTVIVKYFYHLYVGVNYSRGGNLGRIRATSIFTSIFARACRSRAVTSLFLVIALMGCNGTILEGTESDGTGGGFVDGGATSGIGSFTSIQFEADVVGKFWPTTTIDEYLSTGTMPTLAAGYNPKMIINLEKGLKKTLGTTVMASALASLVAGDASIAAIPVTVKFTTGSMKWMFNLGDAFYSTGTGTGAWYTGILIDEEGRGSFISGKLQDTASILETSVGDIIIAGGKVNNLAVNWVGVLPSGSSAITSSEDSGAPIKRLAIKDAKPYLFYVFSGPVLDLVSQTYLNASGTQVTMFSDLTSVTTTLTVLVAHAKSNFNPVANLAAWAGWTSNQLRALTAYQPAENINRFICDNTYNNSATEYIAYSCDTATMLDDKFEIINDATGTTYNDLINPIWNPHSDALFTPSYPIPANQTDTIKIGAI